MGRPADPWGATQARHQCRPNHRGQVHGNEKTATLARLEDLPAQSCRRHRRNGHVCRTDGVVSIALRAFDPAACAPGAAVVGGNSPSERPMGRTAIDRSIRLEGRTAIPYSRPRFCLWGRLHSACWGYGHSRPTGLGALAMAERIRGEADRLDPARLSRPCGRLWQMASSPSASFVSEILQRRVHIPYLSMSWIQKDWPAIFLILGVRP